MFMMLRVPPTAPFDPPTLNWSIITKRPATKQANDPMGGAMKVHNAHRIEMVLWMKYFPYAKVPPFVFSAA